MRATFCSCLLLLFVPSLARADLRSTYESMEDGRLRFSFEVRDGVYGDGHSIIMRDLDDEDDYDGWDCDCEAGPARVSILVRDGELRRVRARVGGSFRAAKSDEQDLGMVDAVEASRFLLHLAETENTDDAEDAIFAATLARGFDDWDRVVRLARDADRPTEVRKAAVFWLGQAAGEKITRSLEKLVDDEDTELKIREHAIFALSQRDDDEALSALMRVVKTNPHPQLKEQALFWMAQIDDPAVVDVFEDILTQD